MNEERIAFVVEGDVREQDVVSSLKNTFFKNPSNLEIISFPAGQNIYMLWKCLMEDEFATDIIELVRDYNSNAKAILEGLDRDSFSEVYLFFDYDGHHNNLEADVDEDVLERMLATFDNETENGKLYVNYPMVESLRTFVEGDCKAEPSCFISVEELNTYKKQSALQTNKNDLKKYTYAEWREIINSFVLRTVCLFDNNQLFSRENYMQVVSPRSIYTLERKYMTCGFVFALSGFPEFLLDYNKTEFWKTTIKLKKCVRENCTEKRM